MEATSDILGGLAVGSLLASGICAFIAFILQALFVRTYLSDHGRGTTSILLFPFCLIPNVIAVHGIRRQKTGVVPTSIKFYTLCSTLVWVFFILFVASGLLSGVALVHGQDDPRATLTEGRQVFNAAPGIKEFVVFERTGHESYVSAHPQKRQSAVKELIRRVETSNAL